MEASARSSMSSSSSSSSFNMLSSPTKKRLVPSCSNTVGFALSAGASRGGNSVGSTVLVCTNRTSTLCACRIGGRCSVWSCAARLFKVGLFAEEIRLRRRESGVTRPVREGRASPYDGSQDRLLEVRTTAERRSTAGLSSSDSDGSTPSLTTEILRAILAAAASSKGDDGARATSADLPPNSRATLLGELNAIPALPLEGESLKRADTLPNALAPCFAV
mmetsp:Transcript_72592/g.166477  ORF Transcript_72592/g.166477 Transcript_72592/m.166477 type:complete len:219 (-) Transcript_72592:1162-1818(-)